MAATAVSSAPIAINVMGSPDLTPNRRLPSVLDKARPGHSKRETQSGQSKRAEHDAALHVKGGRSQRHPNADFLHSLTDRERNHAVDSERREYQCESGESGQQEHQKSPR